MILLFILLTDFHPVKYFHRRYPYMEAILKCEITQEGSWAETRLIAHCIDKNERILSTARGSYRDIGDWIENDVLLQRVCDERHEPPPITTTTPKTTTTKYIPPSCDYLKGGNLTSSTSR